MGKTLLQKNKSVLRFLLALLFLFNSAQIFATHLMGSDISYRCIGQGKYEVILSVYRDCGGIPLNYTQNVKLSCNTSSWDTTYVFNRVSITDITGLDPNCTTKSKCAGGSFSKGFEAHKYVATIDVSLSSCKSFTISWSISARNSTITTGAANKDFYTEATFRSDIGCNSSPIFTTPAAALVCVGNDNVFNNGAVDTVDQGDSLSYKLVAPLSAKGVSIGYAGLFSATRPLTFLGFPSANLSLPSGFHLDPITGDLSFRPQTLNEAAVIVLEVTEWRNDSTGTMRVIGTTRRDMQVIVISCTNANPTITGRSIQTCSNRPVCIDFKTFDTNSGDSVKLTWNKGIPGATFTTSNGGALKDTAQLCWTPTENDVSNVPYTFTVTAADNACPFAGKEVRAFTIFVYEKPRAVTSTINLGCGHVNVGFTPNKIYQDLTHIWTVKDSLGKIVSTSSRQFDTLLIPKGKMIVTLRLSALGGCETFYEDTVIIPEHVEVHNFSSDTIACENTTVNVNTYIVDGVAPFKYVWNTSANDTLPTLTLDTAKGSKYWVTVTDGIGCTWWDTVRINWNKTPKAGFSNTAGCEKNPVVFDNTAPIVTDTVSYFWNFGDNDTSTQRIPIHTYSVNDTFSVTLKTLTNKGCADSITQNISIHPLPDISFTAADSLQCLNGNNFVFNNTTTIDYGTINYKWFLGNGDSSIIKNPNYSYAKDSIYTTKLYATSNFLCKDSLNKTITVYPSPKAAFSINDTAQCVNGNAVAYTNHSTVKNGALTYNWYFGDGASSSVNSPIHSFVNQNIYTTKLVATSINNCKDSVTNKVYIYPKPTVAFSINDSSQCLNTNNFNFTNLSTIDYGSMSHKWAFGDGGNALTTNSQHNYTSVNTFTVKLVSTSNFGCADSIQKQTVVRPMPKPSFTINDSGQCVNDNLFGFSNTSTIQYGSMSYSWNFANGKTCNCFDTALSYTIDSIFRPVLKATSNFGCIDTFGKYVVVHSKPSPNFSINNSAQCRDGNLFTFTNLSTIKQGTLSHQWAFGDGATSIINSPMHSYSADSIYTVRLVARSDSNCFDTTYRTATINSKPKALFTTNNNNQCYNTNQYTFTNQSTIKTGTLTYWWNFGNGKQSTQTDTAFSYAKDTTYAVTLIAKSDKNCYDTLTTNMVVYPVPVPNFTINDSAQCLNTNNYVFTNKSTVKYGSITHNWQFDTEGSSALQNPSFVFAKDTLYTIKLKETSNYGCSDSIYKKINIYPLPQVSFSINDSAQCVNTDNFVFTNQSKIKYGTMQYVWFFGNGDSIVAPNSSYNYAKDGTYTATLKATSNYNCIDSLRKQLTAIPKPIARFAINDSSQCVNPGIFTFTNQSTIKYATPLSYNWDFGNTITSTAVDTMVNYPINGEYYTTLITKTQENCYDTFTRLVLVYPKPYASFTINKDTQCLLTNNYFLTNTTTIDSGVINYKWFFDDGDSSTQTNGQHIYTKDGIYNVALVARSDFGCLDTNRQRAYVQARPTIDFEINDSGQCVNNNLFVFTNKSSIQFGALSYQWDFANGATCNCFDTAVNYNYDSTYRVVLKAVSDFGCSDTAGRYVVVHSKPTPMYSVNDSSQCLKTQQFDFTNTSTVKTGSIGSQFWTFSDGRSETASSFSIKFSNPITYQLKQVVSSNFGCKDSVSGSVLVYPHPNPDFTGLSNYFCTDYPSVSLQPTIAGGVFSGDNVAGNTYTPTNFLGNDTVTYTVQVNGCFSDTSKYTIVHPLPTLSLGADTTLCLREPIFFDVSFPLSTYLWQDGTKTPNYVATHPGLYKITLFNICDTIADEINIYYRDYDCNYFFPTAFTPDGDGLNDVFLPYFDNLQKIEFKVFDRWGATVFYTNQLAKGWDGKFANGYPAPDGVYLWHITTTFSNLGVEYRNTHRGSITLLR